MKEKQRKSATSILFAQTLSRFALRPFVFHPERKNAMFSVRTRKAAVVGRRGQKRGRMGWKEGEGEDGESEGVGHGD